MKLTNQQRKSLFAGDPVKITFPGALPCSIAKGHVEILSAHVKLEVTDIRRTKDGDHSLVYTLYNNRLGQRFLAVQDGQAHPEQYAFSGGSGVDPEAGEAVDDFTQKRITREAQDSERVRLERLLAEMQKVRSALDDRVREHPDLAREIGRELWQIRGRIDAAQNRLKRRLAA